MTARTKLAVLLGIVMSILALAQAFLWPNKDAILFAPGGLLFILLQGGVHERGVGAVFALGTIFNLVFYSVVFWLLLALIAKMKRSNHA